MKDLNKFMNALCNVGGDAYLVETCEDAQWLNDCVQDREVAEILPGQDDFEVVCARLDLTPANNPKRVWVAANYNEEAVYFALAEDWEIA